MSAFRRALSRPWLVGALVMGVGTATPFAQQALRSLANTPVTSRAAGDAHPLDVILIGEDGTPASLTVEGVTVTDVGITSLTLGSTAVSALDLTNSNPIATALVDANGDQITSFGGGTQYTEDAAAASNPIGNALIGVRADSLAAITSADGDNVALRSTNKGELYVKQSDSVAVTGTFWQTTQPVSLASVPSHAVTNAGTFAVQAAQSGTWNLTNISGTVSLPTGAATAANQSTGNTSLSSIDGKFTATAAMADNTTNPTLSKIAVYNMCFDGTTWDRCLASTDGTHDSAVSTAGPQIMGEAASDVSANTAVADGDATRFSTDLIGRLINVGACDRGGRVRSVTTVTDGSSTSAIAASGTGVYTEVWDITVANTSATAVTLDIRDGTAGTVLWTGPVPANTLGLTTRLAVPITSSANTAIAVDPSASASSIIVSLGGCKAK